MNAILELIKKKGRIKKKTKEGLRKPLDSNISAQKAVTMIFVLCVDNDNDHNNNNDVVECVCVFFILDSDK